MRKMVDEKWLKNHCKRWHLNYEEMKEFYDIMEFREGCDVECRIQNTLSDCKTCEHYKSRRENEKLSHYEITYKM
jgi:hypothetical protein